MIVDSSEEGGGEMTKEDAEEEGEVSNDQGNGSNPTDSHTQLGWNKEMDQLSSSQVKHVSCCMFVVFWL